MGRGEWGDAGCWILIEHLVLEGIEEPDKNFLFDETCRYVTECLYTAYLEADCCVARIITHAPLRAKEASPFVSNKYPVVVCTLGN
jgi:hypothetical protein